MMARGLLLLALLASGAAGLIFELLWFRQAGLTFGNTIWASTSVLAAFMAGLALGYALAGSRLTFKKPLLWYAAAEILIAGSGLALLWLLPVSGGLVVPLGSHPALHLVLAFALMLIPTTAMGLTLPLVLRALYAGGYGSLLGALYGLNTLGAVAGVIAVEYWLLQSLGLLGSGLAAAGLNLLAALLALGLSITWPPSRETRSRSTWPWRTGARWLLAAGLGGTLLLALEIVWFRLLLLHVRGTATAFAAMLALVLGGIALGGFLAGLWLRRDTAGRWLALLAALLGAAGVTLGYSLLPLETGVEPWLPGLILMGLTACASGVLFTALAHRYALAIPEPSRATGRILVANTTGGALGAALGGLLLLPLAGIETSLILLLAGYLLCALHCLPNLRLAPLATMLAAGLAALALFPYGRMQAHLDAAIQPWQQLDQAQVIYREEGLNETVQLLQRELFGEPLAHRVVTNGASMSGTERDSRRYMKLFAWLPMALHPGVEDALLISYGLGSTAEALTGDPDIRHIDVVDISPEILAASRLTRTATAEPLDDPRVAVHIEDGRHYLHKSEQQYDLITGEPPPPRLAGIVNLYTREYFHQLHARLKPGGLASYWLPVDQLTLDSSRAILAAFCSVFEDCSLWSGSNYNWIMLGSRGGLKPVNASQLERLWQTPGLRSQLGALGLEDPAQLGAAFLADATQIARWTGHAAPLTDNWPKRLHENGPTAHTQKRYANWLDSNQAAKRFAASNWLQQRWPPALRQRSLDYYALQPILNNEIRAPLAMRLRMVDGITEQTALRIPVFWLLDSGIREQGIVDRRMSQSGYQPEYAWHLGVRALAERRPGVAADLFSDYLTIDSERALPAAVYTLCRSGQADRARALARSAVQSPPDLRCW